MLNKDAAEKKRRGYTDPKSFVRNDGSEVLFKTDWDRRKVELWERCHGRCERVVALNGNAKILCMSIASDPHHIKPRSKGRDDRLENLQALCRYHHNLLDKRKIGGRHASKD